MLQLLALLATSWLLLWLFEKEGLSPLGLTPTPTRLQYARLLFLASAGCAATIFALRTHIAKETYTLSPSLTPQTVMLECWYQFRTVMTEELLCRGALLYILIKKISPQKGIVLSSLVFAVLHWLNAGVWGNLPKWPWFLLSPLPWASCWPMLTPEPFPCGYPLPFIMAGT